MADGGNITRRLAIFAGCALCNRWEMVYPPEESWWAILLTKVGQVAVMLFLAARLRPEGEEAIPSRALSATERQIWSFIPGYYGGFLMLFLLNRYLPSPIAPAPVLAILSGMGFASLGSTIWGWFYVWAAFFFALYLIAHLVLRLTLPA